MIRGVFWSGSSPWPRTRLAQKASPMPSKSKAVYRRRRCTLVVSFSRQSHARARQSVAAKRKQSPFPSILIDRILDFIASHFIPDGVAQTQIQGIPQTHQATGHISHLIRDGTALFGVLHEAL